MYSELVLRHFQTPRNQRSLPAADGEGLAGMPEAGHFIRIQVRLGQECVQEAAFECNGCLATIACASFLTEWATGRKALEVLRMTADDLEKMLGGIPLHRKVCAIWTVVAMQRALLEALGAPHAG